MFGLPDVIVCDNYLSFTTSEFSDWYKERNIHHCRGPAYHPATNSCAERFIQTFKSLMKTSVLPRIRALHEIIMQYRRMPLDCELSHSELSLAETLNTLINKSLAINTSLKQTFETFDVKLKFVGSLCYTWNYYKKRCRSKLDKRNREDATYNAISYYPHKSKKAMSNINKTELHTSPVQLRRYASLLEKSRQNYSRWCFRSHKSERIYKSARSYTSQMIILQTLDGGSII
ncbi:hypothetical protein RF11_09983 [Thelohanellus kitauei]|uniref:Integrase catalytic domain-containing protein n=1 Tax=Thelohanellus kitauei TaxID=669202 RepID=A0A0C2MPH0_THEKT|nr:hypothetical protein RF11_09983 [Thelohanellus kitauei]